MRAFELGAQFYFTDFLQPDQSISTFKRAGKVDLKQQRPVEQSLHAFEGDMMKQILTVNLIGTLTVGFDAKKSGTYVSMRIYVLPVRIICFG